LASRESKAFCFLQCVHTGSETHATSFAVGTGDIAAAVKPAGCEADMLPPTSVEVMNSRSPACSPVYDFVARYLSKHDINFTLIL
jgi:hypothetical protein